MTGLVIRRAGDTDWDALASIHAELFRPSWDARALRDLSDPPGTVSFVAITASKAVGFAMMRVAAEEAEILTLAVASAYQRRGLGHALLSKAAEDAQRKGAQQMFLEVSSQNHAALALYQRAGFEKVGERKAYYPAANENISQNAVVMRAALPLRKLLGKT